MDHDAMEEIADYLHHIDRYDLYSALKDYIDEAIELEHRMAWLEK